MTVEQIQGEVGQLTEAERRQLSAWMLANYPARSVDELVSRAEEQAMRGEWTQCPPTPQNFPRGTELQEALQRLKTTGSLG